jgi:hypothetical protein
MTATVRVHSRALTVSGDKAATRQLGPFELLAPQSVHAEAGMPRKLSAPWPVRAPLVGNAKLGQQSSAGLVGPTIDVDDDAQWTGMEAALEMDPALGEKLGRELRGLVEHLIMSARLEYQQTPVSAADVIRAIKMFYREPLPTNSCERRLEKSCLDAASRLALIHLEINEWSPHDTNISQFANARLPKAKRGRRSRNEVLRRLIVGLEKVFEAATGHKLSATGSSRTVAPRTVRGVRYEEGADIGPFPDFVEAVLRFVPEAPPLPRSRLATLVKNRPRKHQQ